MDQRPRRASWRHRCLLPVVSLACLGALPATVHADTVASLLGNFTTNQYCGVQLADGAAHVRYAVVFGQLPALRELHLADADGDGVTTEVEREAYAKGLAAIIGERLRLTVDGVPAPLHAVRWTSSLPNEQGGFSLRVDVELDAALPAPERGGTQEFAFANQNFPGQFGWQEITLAASPPLSAFATDAFATSLTAGLTEAVAQVPATGPLHERAVHASLVRGPAPPDARPPGPRPGATPATTDASPVAPDPATTGDALRQATRRLVAMISAPDVTPRVLALALLAALVLGALHAFSPGHGKTVVGAYLIGSRATARHAVFLGVTVTATHTLGVFAMGWATLVASRYVLPETLLPALSLVSGILVLGMGLALLRQRWRAAWNVARSRWLRSAPRPAYRPLAHAAAPGATHFTPMLAHAHGHAAGSGMHSHGGTWHTHLPPGATGEAVTWRSLAALGVSGGLVPCPSAMVLLLAAVALNKTAYGMLLVLAFSVGLAATLTLVGLAFLHARHRVAGATSARGWMQFVPAVSAGAIAVVGAVLCVGALTSLPV